jgi:hypothetical protein
VAEGVRQEGAWGEQVVATLEQEQQQREQLKTVLNALAEIRPESLVRADVLGKELSFESGLPIFSRTLHLFRDLSQSNLDDVSFETLQNLTNLARQVFDQLQSVQNFSTTQANPAQARDSLINQIRDQWNRYYEALTPVISYTARRATDFDRLEREARGAVTELQQIGTDARKERDKMMAEMNAALEQVRRVAAEAGVAQHAIHFSKEAESNLRQSKLWLVVAVVFGLVTAVYAFYGLEIQLREVAANVQTTRLIQLALSRIVIISILSYGLVFSARNFAASRHNFVINRHRQNALSTFETFAKAAGDAQTKDAVLMQATQSIFALQTSGYLRAEHDTAQQGGQIIEVVRNLTAKD